MLEKSVADRGDRRLKVSVWKELHVAQKDQCLWAEGVKRRGLKVADHEGMKGVGLISSTMEKVHAVI